MITLASVISLVESTGRPHAMRFEAAMFQDKPLWVLKNVPFIMGFNACSRDTALMIACTSWGEYQCLGVNVYDMLYTSNIMEFATDSFAQAEVFGKFIARHGFNPTEDVTTWIDSRFNQFAGFYNGPGNIDAYTAAMKKAIV